MEEEDKKVLQCVFLYASIEISIRGIAMEENNMRPFFLLHITTEEKAKDIMEEKRMYSSIHNENENSIQWLGDGVYFWDGNDIMAQKHGKKMVSKRYKNEKIVGLSGIIKVNNKRFVDLENKNWNSNFMNFSREVEFFVGDSLCDLLDSVRNSKYVNRNTLYKIGNLMGKIVNLYVKMLFEKKHKEIDIFSCYFYHGKNNLYYFGRNDRNIKQFCIKNDKLISDNIDKMKIDYNI